MMLAHGGIAGAIGEVLAAVAIVVLAVVVCLRERRRGTDERPF